MLRKKVQADADELAARVRAITDAERDLDLLRAEQRVDELAEDYGGTSPTVAERRELQHRLVFYLERIARAGTNVARVDELMPSEPLRRVKALVDAARASLEARGERDLGSGAVGLRSLVQASTAAKPAKAAKTALPAFKQYREADGKFYFKLLSAGGDLLLQSEGFEQGRDAGQWVARLKREGAAALTADAPVQRAGTEADITAALAAFQEA